MFNLILFTWPKTQFSKIQDGGGRHLENRFFGHNSSIDCTITAKFYMRKQNDMSKSANFLNPRWRTAAILKIVKLPYLSEKSNKNLLPIMVNDTHTRTSSWRRSEKSSDFDKIWYTTSDIEPDYSHVTKNWNFWNSRWRRPPSWKSLFWP